MASCRTGVGRDGLQFVRLENSRLSVSLLPEAGGKIAELRDRRTGRNWLWENPHLPVRRAIYAADYGRELDSGGWDEILFSTDPCDVELPDGRRCAVPDHGDLVGQSWKLLAAETDASQHAVCDLAATGHAFACDWRRIVTLDAERPLLTLRYSLANSGDTAWPWLWCAHPLIAIERGMRIELPSDLAFRVTQTTLPRAEPSSAELRWPRLPLRDGGAVDLGASFADAHELHRFAAKLFVASASPGEIGLCSADAAERLTFRYDASEIPWVGLWINAQSWSGCGSPPYLNLGVEPSTSPCDSLTAAIAEDRAGWLQPGQTRTWSLRVEVQS
jgi:galactose mutarotase-like enzyme